MIPPFDHNNVLPPYVGATPMSMASQSPYKCEILEFCQRFATSWDRVKILKGFVRFRIQCCKTYVRQGFQWIDGSFMENVEESQHRSPNDIDVVTFAFGLNDYIANSIKNRFPEFLDSTLSKPKYMVDHYLIVADDDPLTIIESVRYWNQLFGHNRIGVWKGMVEVPLYEDDAKDNEALQFLDSINTL